MPRNSEPQSLSPLNVLSELAVEGASSFIEAQRIFLKLAQQENNLLLNGVKERVGGSAPAAAATDLVRRGLDTLIDMQHEFLTTTSKQTMHLLEAVQTGKNPTGEMAEVAREGMASFVRANQKFLDAVTEETIKATSGKTEPRPGKKTELSQLAREAGDLFIDAQKKVLDVVGQQMNVNLNTMGKAVETLSPARIIPMAQVPAKAVKDFIEAEKSLLHSVVTPKNRTAGKRPGRQKKTA